MSNNKRFYVAGVQFRPGAAEVIRGIKEGDELELIPEPTNKYDPNAVAIYFGEDHIGYVPKKFSSEISAMIETEPDTTCVATQVNPKNKMWEMLEVEIIKPEESSEPNDDPGELKENEDFAQDNDYEHFDPEEGDR